MFMNRKDFRQESLDYFIRAISLSLIGYQRPLALEREEVEEVSL
jgi:hypothetical protein